MVTEILEFIANEKKQITDNSVVNNFVNLHLIL